MRNTTIIVRRNAIYNGITFLHYDKGLTIIINHPTKSSVIRLLTVLENKSITPRFYNDMSKVYYHI